MGSGDNFACDSNFIGFRSTSLVKGSLTYQCVSAPTSDVRNTLELPFTREVDLKPMKLESQAKLSPEPIRPHPTVTTHLQFQFPTQEAIVLLVQQE